MSEKRGGNENENEEATKIRTEKISLYCPASEKDDVGQFRTYQQEIVPTDAVPEKVGRARMPSPSMWKEFSSRSWLSACCHGASHTVSQIYCINLGELAINGLAGYTSGKYWYVAK